MTVPGCTYSACSFLRPTDAGRLSLVKLGLGQGVFPVVASRQLWRAGADVECRTGRAVQPTPVPRQQLTCTGWAACSSVTCSLHAPVLSRHHSLCGHTQRPSLSWQCTASCHDSCSLTCGVSSCGFCRLPCMHAWVPGRDPLRVNGVLGPAIPPVQFASPTSVHQALSVTCNCYAAALRVMPGAGVCKRCAWHIGQTLGMPSRAHPGAGSSWILGCDGKKL